MLKPSRRGTMAAACFSRVAYGTISSALIVVGAIVMLLLFGGYNRAIRRALVEAGVA